MSQWMPSGPGEEPTNPSNLPVGNPITLDWSPKIGRRVRVANASSANIYVLIDSGGAGSTPDKYTFVVAAGETVFYDGKFQKVSLASDSASTLTWGTDFHVTAWT